MRRISSLAAAAAAATLAVLGTSCGVLADTTAATVAGEPVSVESVEQLSRDEALIGQIDGLTDSTVPGELFRGVLAYEIQRTAWIAEAERWGVPVTESDRAAAREELAADASTAGYDDATTDKLVDYIAAQQALEARFAQLDASSDEDLRLLYEGLRDNDPDFWDRHCVAVAAVPADTVDEVSAALDAGTTIEELPEVVDGVQTAADTAQCVSPQELPTELADAFRAATLGESSGPVSVSSGDGGEEALYVFRVDERRRIGFDEARGDLTSIAAQLSSATTWISWVVSHAEIDDRFGADVSVDAQGQPTIGAPPVPLTTGPDLGDLFAATSDPAAGATP